LIFPFVYVWWKRKSRVLHIYEDGRIVLEKGVLNKEYQEIVAKHVRSIRIRQNVLNRMLNIGTIIIATAGRSSGFDEELNIEGILRPNKTREYIQMVLKKNTS
jgi:uncharacterized membrane protein YdbT with pleckstrin-like domain